MLVCSTANAGLLANEVTPLSGTTFTINATGVITGAISASNLSGTNTGDQDLTEAEKFYWSIEPKNAKLPSTNPLGIDAGNNQWRALFDDATDECGRWQGTLYPYQAGGLQAKVFYSLETTSSSKVVSMEVYVMCVSDGDSEDVDTDSFGTVNTLSSPSQSLTAGYLDVLTDTSLNEDSCAENDLIIIKVCRDANGADTAIDDVELRGVLIYE